MATTNFTNGTIVESSWLNDVDEAVYQYSDVPIARAIPTIAIAGITISGVIT